MLPAAGATQRLGQAGRLRVVQHDDVPGAHEREQLLRVPAQHALVVAALARAELAAVAGRAVDPVVDPLRDREELRVALDDEPTRVDAGGAHVGKQRLQHLGDAAAGRGRVHVPDRAAAERGLRRLGDVLVERHPVGADQGLEPRRVERLHLDLVHAKLVRHGHQTATSVRVMTDATSSAQAAITFAT